MKDVVKTPNPGGNHTRPRARRRRNLSLYYLMIFTVCVIIFLILARTVLFNISEYVVEGNSIYTADAILAAGGLHEGRNMYGINLEKTEKKIKDKLVYIEDIKLRRKLPDKFLVTVTEARAFACCEYEGNRYAVITKSGRYLETEQLGPRAGLIQIKGMELTGVAIAADFVSQDETKRYNSRFDGSNLGDMRRKDNRNRHHRPNEHHDEIRGQNRYRLRVVFGLRI